MLRKYFWSSVVLSVLASMAVLLPVVAEEAGAAQPVPGHTCLVPATPRTEHAPDHHR